MSINHGTSVYHRVAASYQRDSTGTLLVVDGRYATNIQSQWTELYQLFFNTEASEMTELASGKTITTTDITPSSPLTPQHKQPTLHIHELYDPTTPVIRGLVTFPLESESNTDTTFLTWAKTFLLLNTRHLTTSPTSAPTSVQIAVAERITTLFEETLKNTSHHDLWHVTGRQYFQARVHTFIKDNARIEFCLPAFPCKSSNPEKVAGVVPDAAEYLALSHLSGFIERVCEIYHPGATLWIVSDGHVFSDNIGVDDALVDSYGEILANTYMSGLSPTQREKKHIQFTGLEDLFFSSPESTSSFTTDMLSEVSIPQPIETVVTESAQKCRLLLERIGGIDRGHLRGLIDAKHADTLALYQGQSRFMLEDLGAYMDARMLGGKARKRLASKVAEEMIARNHAYSNLVELLFPHHIRLSIHAHTNAGPKFGIRLFPHGSVRAAPSTQSLLALCDSASSSSSSYTSKGSSGPLTNTLYEFQIPTAWHNALVQVDGVQGMLLTRSGIVRDAIKTGHLAGSWVEHHSSQGGYFSIRRVKQEEDTHPVVTDLALQTISETEADLSMLKERTSSGLQLGAYAARRSLLVILGAGVWGRVVAVWGVVRAVMGTAGKY
ncbi:isocyanide synthase family protein [Aspergillus mulundensis]|uniref:Spore wall maturation protein DIT1 n=1 Tax=Aspergillus mulundensis TaxID=1810919 RepID=A0A3D8QJC7_9EURO|nr:Uncharacterized protein DSM5745_10452 [Aspergillus mulundensis]RDW61780.1 Uncharacterized protein DSM5745_10452 [Aspergillus mulundensis]